MLINSSKECDNQCLWLLISLICALISFFTRIDFDWRVVDMPMVTYFLIIKSTWKRCVVDNEHDNHGSLRKKCIGQASERSVLDHSIFARVVNENASTDANQVQENVEARDTIEPILLVFHPFSVSAIWNSPTIGVKKNDVKTVENDKFAHIAPHAQK